MKTNIDKKIDSVIEKMVKKELAKIDFDKIIEKVMVESAKRFKSVRKALVKRRKK